MSIIMQSIVSRAARFYMCVCICLFKSLDSRPVSRRRTPNTTTYLLAPRISRKKFRLAVNRGENLCAENPPEKNSADANIFDLVDI